MEKIISKSQVEQICVIIKCGDVNGTGFYIGEDIVLTARHNVIDSIDKGVVIGIDNIEYESKAIMAQDAKLDMCLIKVETKNLNYLSLIITQLFFKQDCSTYGFPNYSDKSGEHFDGKINTLPKDSPYDIRLKIKGIEDYDYSGLSGAPVIIEGKLIGIARMQIDDEIGVVSFIKAKEFLNSNSIRVIEDPKTMDLPEEIEDSVVSSVANYKTSDKLNKAIKDKYKWLLCSGSPGSGKTTFTANFKPYNEEILICGKYFIKIPNDKEPIEVRTSVRSILSWLEVSISKALRNNIDLLDKLEDRIKRVETLLSTLSISGVSKRYLFIIDGLDEVKNIESFLGIFPINIPQNIQIIISCTNKDILPSNIKNEIENENEIRIDPLELGDCETYIKSKLKRKKVSVEIIQKLAIKSEGHPLYLNYLINSLNALEINDDELEEWISNNPSIGGDIEKYYHSIWDSFFRSQEKLWIISTISQFRNPVNEKLLINCLPKEHKHSFYSELPQIRYLTNGSKNFELYHRSFKNFIGKKVPEILPIINDNIFDYCDLNKGDVYSIENWLFHKQHSTKSRDSVRDCNQEWADYLCFNHINPELIIEDIKVSVSKAVDFELISEVVRILLLLQRIEFRYDSLFAENSFELCKSMISMGEFSASLRYLVREDNLLVTDYDALYFLQQYYENNAIQEGDQLLDVLESRFRLYLENEFKKPEVGFSLMPFQIMMQAFALSVHSKGKKAISYCLNLTEDLKRFQDAALKDKAFELSDVFLNTRAIGSAWLNAYTLRCFDYYTPIDEIKKLPKNTLNKTWIQMIALTVIFYNDFDDYDTVQYNEAENYINLIKDIEWLIDNHEIEDDISLKKIVLKALINDSSRTDIVEMLITSILESENPSEGLLKSKNGVDVNFEKMASNEFKFLCEGFIQKEKLFNELELSNSDWESYLFSIFKEVHLLEGKILRVKKHSSSYELIDCYNHLNNIISSISFNLSERAYWDRSYLIPEDTLPIIFSKITSLYLLYFLDKLKWYTDYLKLRYDDQLGLYNEGYRATLIKIIQQFIFFNIEKKETVLIIDALSNFIVQNIENRWERTPELLLVNQFYNLVGEHKKADNIYKEAIKTSMGPSWYKESQFSILNTAFSLSSKGNDVITNASKVAYLLNEASGEMTFQRYVRQSKESFIGLLTEKGCYSKAIELLKFETVPPNKALVEGAEFYDFDLIRSGSGYSYGGNNIAIEAGILELIKKCDVKRPELKIALAYIFALHNEVFRHINDFGKSIGSNLNLIDNVDLKRVVFSWIFEISNSSKIKGEEKNFINAIDSVLSNMLKKDFNTWANEESVDINFKIVEVESISKEKDEGKKKLDAFDEFNEKYQKNLFETDSQIMQEAALVFSKEKMSVLMGRRWSTSSKITRSIIKKNTKDSSHLLKIFNHYLQNIDEEAWEIADDLIWFGNEIFSDEEIESIQDNIYNHIDLLVYRKKTMKDRYSWLLEDELINNSDDEIFRLLLWLMDYPDNEIRNKTNNIVHQLFDFSDVNFLTIAIKEAKSSDSKNLRIKLFKMILDVAYSKPNEVNNALSNIGITSLMENLDLISSKFLKDIGVVLKSFDFKELSDKIVNKFNVKNDESRDVFFEDDRFDCIDFVIEDLVENDFLSPSVCKNLEKAVRNGFNNQDIELLMKSNHYLRQSFRESRTLSNSYKDRAILCLNDGIMPIVNIENMDRVFELINV
ncbi:S1 family peptidase [Aquimarina latercula]|uniref:S1 family peptidase n=1 Tax=Aquimarina latercula TaxID=987 RepID=UPI0004052BB1|nr:serine protease [Aquimarina latercula]